MGYRPVKLPKGWTKSTPKELREAVEDYLHEFTKTSAYDSGVRLAEAEAYLQGIEDTIRLSQQCATDSDKQIEGIS